MTLTFFQPLIKEKKLSELLYSPQNPDPHLTCLLSPVHMGLLPGEITHIGVSCGTFVRDEQSLHFTYINLLYPPDIMSTLCLTSTS